MKPELADAFRESSIKNFFRATAARNSHVVSVEGPGYDHGRETQIGSKRGNGWASDPRRRCAYCESGDF